MDKEKPKNAGHANIIPPVKGEVRNPKGRGKGVRNRSTIIREILENAAIQSLMPSAGAGKDINEAVKPKTIFEQMVVSQVVKAVASSDTAAFNALTDSAFGKLTDKVENTHSFTKMGRVVAEPVNGTAQSTAGEVQAVALSFDVGEEPKAPEGEEQDQDQGEDKS